MSSKPLSTILHNEIHLPFSTLYQQLQKTANSNPNQSIYFCLGKQFSNADFIKLVNNISAAFINQDLKKGDRVAILLPNVVQFPAVFYACIKAGIILMPINPLLSPSEISNFLRLSSARVLIYLDLFTHKINNLDNDLPLEKFISTSVTDFASTTIKLAFPILNLFKKKTRFNRNAPLIHFKDFIKSIAKTEFINEDENDIAILLGTGGTTGVSKLAALSNKNLFSNALQVAELVPHIKSGSVLLAALPLFHSFGLTICLNVSLLKQLPVVLVPKFKSKTVFQLINKHHIQLMPGVPIMFAAMSKYARESKKQIPSLQECFSGGTELLSEIKYEFEKMTNAKVTEAYGLTEGSPAITSNPIKGKQKDGSIGIPLIYTQVKIVNPENFEELAPDEIGEIVVKGPQVMQGYWENDDENENTFKNGWLLTGDLAKKDEDGYIFITGRKKEMITHCGFKIYPQEVEKVLLEHPLVKEVGVCAINDGYKGESVKAVVVLENSDESAKKILLKHCQQKLAPFKVPKEMVFVDALPKSFLGKVVRRLLVEQL